MMAEQYDEPVDETDGVEGVLGKVCTYRFEAAAAECKLLQTTLLFNAQSKRKPGGVHRMHRVRSRCDEACIIYGFG